MLFLIQQEKVPSIFHLYINAEDPLSSLLHDFSLMQTRYTVLSVKAVTVHKKQQHLVKMAHKILAFS